MDQKRRPQSQYMSTSSTMDYSSTHSSTRQNPESRASAESQFAAPEVPAGSSNIPYEIDQNNQRDSVIIPPNTPKKCVVCGEKGTARYYGAIACTSYGAFFQRAVENDTYLKYVCRRIGYCTIDGRTKLNCSFCRFRKCIIVGMDPGRVSLAEERRLIALIHSQRERWDILESFPRPQCSYVPKVIKADCLSNDDQIQIASIVTKYHQACSLYPFSTPAPGRKRISEIVEMCYTAFRRFISFSRLIDDFASLPAKNQVELLRTSIIEMCMLRGTICIDMKGRGWPNSDVGGLGDFPVVTMSELHDIISSTLFCLDIDFLFAMQNLGVDEPIALMLIVIVLFNPNRVGVGDKEKICGIRSKYVLLLQKYAHLKFGSSEGTLICLKYITKLRTLTKLSHFHDKYLINLDANAFRIIRNLFDIELDSILHTGARNIVREIPRSV